MIIPQFFTPAEIQRIHILFHQLLHVAYSNPFVVQGANYALTSLVIELAEQKLRSLDKDGVGKPSDRNLIRIMEWIRIHATEPLTVPDIANHFNYNKQYLSRYFKRKTGMSIQQNIHMVQLNQAKRLLAETTQGIKEISQQIGISDEKYFMKLFKKYEHITPTEFRRAHRNIHLNRR